MRGMTNLDLDVFPNLTDEGVENLVNIDSILRGCLEKSASKVCCQIATLYEG